MTVWLAGVLRQRRSQRAEQSGMVLAATLTAMFVTALLVTAMLALSFASTTFAGNQLDRDDETRAAESALTAAIARIARDENAVLGSLNDTEFCNTEEVMTVDTNGQTVEVTCDAESPRAYAPPDQVNDLVQVVGEYEGAPAPSAIAPDLELNAKNWRQTSASGQRCLLENPSSNCFPWREAVSTGEVDAHQPGAYLGTLLSQLGNSSTRAGISYSGFDPLRIIGDVEVRHGAAVLRDSRYCAPAASCEYERGGPGLSVAGYYVQGANGLLSSASSNCGLLQRRIPTVADPRPFQVDGAQARHEKGLSCGSAAAAGLSAAQFSVLSEWSPQKFAAEGPPRAPETDAGTQSWATFEHPDNTACPSVNGTSRVVTLYPGPYDKTKTAVLNRWFSQDSCSEYVFHFRPGDYWFDVGSGSSDPLANSLVFDNPNSYFVFGAGFTAPAAIDDLRDPALRPLCDPEVDGVQITLSGRTSFVHLRGTVDICGTPSGGPTITQEPLPDVGTIQPVVSVDGGYVTRTEWFNGLDINWEWPPWETTIDPLWSNNVNLDPRITSLPTPQLVQCSRGTVFPFAWAASCDSLLALTARFSEPDPEPEPDARINTAVLSIDGTSTNIDPWGSRLSVDVRTDDGRRCGVNFGAPALPSRAGDNGSPGARIYDLLNPGATGSPMPGLPRCESVLQTRADVMNASYALLWDFDPPFLWPLFVEQTPFGINIQSMKMRTGWNPEPTVRPPTTGGSTPALQCGVTTSYYKYSNWCAGRNGQSGPHSFSNFPVRFELRDNCEIWLAPCHLTDRETASVRLGNVNEVYSPNLANNPDARLTSAGLNIRAHSYCQWAAFWGAIEVDCASGTDVSNGPNAMTRIRVFNPNGSTLCETRYRRIPERHDTRFFDLLAPVGGNVLPSAGPPLCNTVLLRNSDLIGKDIRVEFDLVRRKLLDYITDFGEASDNMCLETGTQLIGCKQWGYTVSDIQLLTTSGVPDGSPGDGFDHDPGSVFTGPRSPMRVTSNFDNQPLIGGNSNPNFYESASFSLFGPLLIPGNDLDIRWSGDVTPAMIPGVDNAVLAIINGHDDESIDPTLLVRGLGSDTRAPAGITPPSPPATGVVCCAPARPGERMVELRAWIGREDGEPFERRHLRAVARVRINDIVPQPLPGNDEDPEYPSGTFEPGWNVRIEDWRLCTLGREDADDLTCEVI